jgi:hypothetical protein
MADDMFRRLIEDGDIDGLRRALQVNPGLANRTIHWHLNQDNESDLLHFASDCVGNGWLTNGKEGEIAEQLGQHLFYEWKPPAKARGFFWCARHGAPTRR